MTFRVLALCQSNKLAVRGLINYRLKCLIIAIGKALALHESDYTAVLHCSDEGLILETLALCFSYRDNQIVNPSVKPYSALIPNCTRVVIFNIILSTTMVSVRETGKYPYTICNKGVGSNLIYYNSGSQETTNCTCKLLFMWCISLVIGTTRQRKC